MQFFTWLEATTLAQTVGESLWLTASLSAMHLIGFTLAMSGGVVSNLKATGVLFSGRSIESISRPAIWLLATGLTISLITGSAMFAPRASSAATSEVFQLKMAFLLVSATYQFTMNCFVFRGPALNTSLLRAIGVVGLLLWISLAVVACWFILFE